ncbi:MAG TPA: YihY/virulence factor BrkB family protein [Solirubrobacteraceae bacterium]|nr:YihY/virulence factor BrkB family protein [Solirubrobacteraceae bacterium]
MASPEEAAATRPAASASGRRGPHMRARDGIVSFWRKGYEENVTGLSGMVAYNLLLSIFPFALVVLFIAGRVLRSEELQASLLADLQRIFPTAADSTLSEGIRRLQETSPTVGIAAVVASIWFGSSFWGALDTAFCRIYHCECRTWVQQKLFSIGMFAVVVLFVAATIAVPTIQALLTSGARDLPLGLSEVKGLVYWTTLSIGVLVLFVTLCAIYRLVPKARMPWTAIWPGALGATVAIGIVDLCFPLYLDNISTLRIGTSAVFVLIALVWFYVIALIIIAGAVVNELRFEHVSRRGAAEPG